MIMNQSLIQVLQLLEPAALQAVQFLLAQLVAHVNHAADTHPANQMVTAAMAQTVPAAMAQTVPAGTSVISGTAVAEPDRRWS